MRRQSVRQQRVLRRSGQAGKQRHCLGLAAELDAARQHSEQTGRPARRFKDFIWSTLDSWSRSRRVIGNAEWTGGAANPRFVVTSLARAEHEARHLYETVYCARGDMENSIKECQLDLFADRTSATTMRANQLRLWFAAMAYVLVCALRRIALRSLPKPPAARSASSCSRSARSQRQRPPHQGRDGLRLSLPKRVRPRPFAVDRRGALTTQNRHRDNHQQVRARPHGACHNSPRLRAGSLTRIPCTDLAVASYLRPV